MIKINSQQHETNSGLGNKLFLNFFARALSIETGEPLKNWLQTKIYSGKEEDYDGIDNDNWDYSWPYIDHNESKTTVVGMGTNYEDEYHQNKAVVDLILKHKDVLIQDFGKRLGTFIHIRYSEGDTVSHDDVLSSSSHAYYSSCLSRCYRTALRDSFDCYLASDSPSHPFVESLINEFGLKLYEGTPEETIIFGSMFDNKILSLGTFSWWIGFIGNQNNVMYPDPDKTNYNGLCSREIFECMGDWNKSSKI